MARIGSPLGVSAVLIIVLLAGLMLFSEGRRLTASPNSSTSALPGATPSPTKEQNAALSYQVQTEKQAAQDESGDLRPLTTPQVVKLSSRIIMARCLAVNVRELVGGNIFTFSEFEAQEVLKGEVAEKKFTLRLYGGRLGNREIDSSSMPQFAVGEEVVLSLGSDNTDGYPTIFPQGTFRIALDPQSHQRVVVTKPNRLPMFSARDHQPYSASVPVRLDDFLFSLRKLINGN